MHTLLCLLFLAGCAFSSAATQPPPAPDFHDYVNLDRYCNDAGFGYYALGYRQEKPWVDQLLCLSGEGIRQVDGTKNGATVESKLLTATESDKDIFWIPSRHDDRISLADGIIDACPDKKKPVAVLGQEVEAYPSGATIRRGSRLCMVDGDLVLYTEEGNKEVRRWTDFTPIL